MSQAPRCPYCLDDIAADAEPVRCVRCRTPHHAACFAEHGGCVAYGCQGDEHVDAGPSLYGRQLVTIDHAPTAWIEAGPLRLGWRRLAPLGEQRPPRACPPAYARLDLEAGELRAGQVTRGRAAVYVPEPTAYKRLELHVSQGLRRPEPVVRAALDGAELGLFQHAVLSRPGTHPFRIEVHGPALVELQDPFTFELVLVRGLFSELRSPPVVLFLLGPPGAPALERSPDPAAASPPAPAPAPPRETPAASPLERAVVLRPLPRGGPLPNAWRQLEARDLAGGRPAPDLALGRRVPLAGPWPERLALEAPTRVAGDRVVVRLAGGPPLGRVALVATWTLVRPGGGDVVAPGLPAHLEVAVAGAGGLEPAAAGHEAVEVQLAAAPDVLAATAAARASAPNAALRLQLTAEGRDLLDRVVRGPTRTVTFVAP